MKWKSLPRRSGRIIMKWKSLPRRVENNEVEVTTQEGGE